MKLRNKKTGEIYDFKITPDYDDVMSGWKIENKDFGVRYYSHLAELNEEWEDYKEPKWLRDYWFIDSCGSLIKQEDDVLGSIRREIGNYFETKEEAEKAVEKLKAWKRLKDKGFEFESWFGGSKDISFWIDTEIDENIAKDLDLLFSEEDD